jgi:hypothetical protein
VGASISCQVRCSDFTPSVTLTRDRPHRERNNQHGDGWEYQQSRLVGRSATRHENHPEKRKSSPTVNQDMNQDM